jgi:hypothetical protein
MLCAIKCDETDELISAKCGQYCEWFINLIADNGEDTSICMFHSS